ncbi:MAG: ROK family protein [Armatimonadota bacterium]|nr:ROK family protein [Armatimonadota bacterium]
MWYLGVDLGGTKILTAVVDETGQVAARVRAPTPQTGPAAVVEAIAATAQQALEAAGLPRGAVRAAGVGAPGPADPVTGTVFSPPNLPGWGDVPLADLLRARLEVPVAVENDANAAALGEHWVGAGRGVDDLLYITVGTGIGGGLILRGQLYTGTSGCAGEVGHMVIVPDGPRCACGRQGCLEAVASGPAIARAARAALEAGRPSVLSAVAAEELDAHAVARAAVEGDPLAREVFARAARYLGLAVANLVNLLNPAMVIIGGGVARAGDLLLAPVRRIVDAEAFARPAAAVRIVPAALGADAGALGAVAAARQRLA